MLPSPPRHAPWLRPAPLAAAAALSALLLPPALAQETPAGAVPAVVVTGTRTAVQASRSVADVTVIDRAAIEAATGRTLPELLARQPGLQAWSNGGLGKVSSVSVRGLEARHTLLLIDGVRHGSATVGTPSLDNLPLEAIERIEIVRGPMSALYGSDAVGGVIQVFTRAGAQGLSAEGAATVGSAGTASLAGGARFGSGLLDGAVHLQALRRKGLSDTNPRAPFGAHDPDRDGFDQDSATLRLGLALPQRWRLQGSALVARGESHFDDGPGADSQALLSTEVASLQLSGPLSEGWRSGLRLSRSTDEYDTRVTASPFTPLGVIGTVQTQLAWDHTVATRAGTLLLVAERLEQDVRRPGAPFAVSSRRSDALGLGLNGDAAGHHWQIAVRGDRNSQFGRQTTGSAGYARDLTPRLRLGASASTSFNAPSFNQLYFPGFGNPALLPEKGRHREVSARWHDGFHEIKVTLFGSDIRSYITPGRNPTNVDAGIEGLSLAASTRWAGWELGASAERVDARNDNPPNAQYGKRLPRRARDVLRLDAERRFGPWTFGADLLHAGARFEDLANTSRLDGYTVGDLRLERTLWPGWRLGMRVNNVADRRYETVLGYNPPGREVFLTLRHQAR